MAYGEPFIQMDQLTCRLSPAYIRIGIKNQIRMVLLLAKMSILGNFGFLMGLEICKEFWGNVSTHAFNMLVVVIM